MAIIIDIDFNTEKLVLRLCCNSLFFVLRLSLFVLGLFLCLCWNSFYVCAMTLLLSLFVLELFLCLCHDSLSIALSLSVCVVTLCFCWNSFFVCAATLSLFVLQFSLSLYWNSFLYTIIIKREKDLFNGPMTCYLKPDTPT